MKTKIRTILPFLLACGVLALFTCRNPLLSIGLGDKVDILPPGIRIVSSDGVQNGAYVHGTVTVTGEASDDVSVASVGWVFTDAQSGLSSAVGTATLAADGKNWSFPLVTKQPGDSLYDDGEKNFVLTVTDQSGKTNDTRMLLIFDNTAPQAAFVSPTNGATVYGSVTIRGSSSDNSRISKVQLRVGKAGTGSGDGFVDITGSLYDWSRTFMSNDFHNDATQSNDRGDGTWELPIYCRIYDIAGNVATNEPSDILDPLYPSALVATYGSAVTFDGGNVDPFSLVIDLDRDKPTLVIQMPQNGINTAGTVLVGGTCYDESPGVASVGVQIEALDDAMGSLAWVKKDGSLTDSTYWEPATLNPSKTYWQLAINENEGLYSVNASHHGWLRIWAKPSDGSKEGNMSSVMVRLDNSIPRLENTRFDLGQGDVVAQDYLYAKGTIHFKATAKDDQAITSIKVSLDGGSTYEDIFGGPHVTMVSGAEYTIDYPINTLANPAPPAAQIPPVLLAAKNGLLTVGVKIKDNASPVPYENTWLVTLNMDNVFPTVSYTGTGPVHDPMMLSGNKTTSSEVRGTSADAGTVNGIDSVEVYLVKGLDALNLSGGADELYTTPSFGDPPASAPYTTNSSCKILIDGEYADRALSQVGANVDWWAKLNTTVLPDGPVKIHFVAWDKAGNAAHGVTDGYIRNDPPVIQSITLGTDVNGDGSIGDVASGESKVFTSGYAATGFTVRNNMLRITVNTVVGSGNGTKRCSIKYGGTTEKNVAPFTANSVTITNFTGMPDGAVDGSTFAVLVYDSTVSDNIDPTDELTDTAALAMTFDNSDSTPPRVWLRELSNTKGDITKTDYSVCEEVLSPENTTLQAGHIELRTHTLYNNGSFNPGDPSNTGIELNNDDPEVSGKIVLRGVAWDDQRLAAVYIDIDRDGNGTFEAGESTQILQPGAGNLLVGMNGGSIRKSAAGTDLQSIDLDKGHQVEWYWVWDTSTIDAVARDSVKVRVTAIDAGVNPSADRSYSSSTSPVAAASAVSAVLAGGRYVIAASGTTAFTALGATDNLPGTVFTASRNGTAGDGTGTVYVESTMMYNVMTADVVPYVRRLITSLSSAYTAKPSVFDRTAQGHYPVAESATVQVYGFNFGGASTAISVNATPLAAPLVPDGMPTLHISVTMGVTALSGPLALTVNGVAAQNNSNDNSQASNSEANGVNNDLLTDDRILDIWKFSNVETNSAIKYPMMRISPTQQVGFSYGDIESDFIIRVNGTRTVYEVSPSKYAFNAIAFDQATSPNFYALALNTDRTNDGFGGSPRTGANSSTKMNFFSRQIGSGNAYPGSYQPGTYKRQLEANWNGYQYNSLRSMYPDMVATSPAAPTDGSPTKIYMIYYDQILEQTKFRYGTVGADGNTMDYGLALNLDPIINTNAGAPKIGTAGGSNEGAIGAPLALAHSVYRTGSVTVGGNAYYVVTVEPRNTYTFLLDALSAEANLALFSDAGFTAPVGSGSSTGTTPDFVDYLTPAGMTTLYVRVSGVAAASYRLSYNDRGTANNYQIVGGPATTYKGGQYAAVGVTSTGIAVVAWYDKPNTRLMYSYNDDPSSAGGSSEGQWQAHAVELDADFSGWFVDLAVDGANAVHIAYYNSSNGDLRYVLIPSYNGAPSAPKTVDSFLSTGSNITIMTKLIGGNHVPYISYYCGALTATRHSMRMAYRTNFAALTDGAGRYDNKYTGDWEVTSIPATNIPKDHTVSVGFKDLGAKLLQPIAGYATEVNLETAQPK